MSALALFTVMMPLAVARRVFKALVPLPVSVTFPVPLFTTLIAVAPPLLMVPMILTAPAVPPILRVFVPAVPPVPPRMLPAMLRLLVVLLLVNVVVAVIAVPSVMLALINSLAATVLFIVIAPVLSKVSV